MNITWQLNAQLQRIGVLGPVRDELEQARIITLLEQSDPALPLQIDFYDADTLSAAIVAALSRCLQRAQGFRIVTYHYLLTHHLMRLDLPVQPVPTKSELRSKPPCRALALAGSANSLDKILAIIEQLPLGELTVFIVQHVQENQINLLDELLKVRTAYRVLMPQQMTAVQPGTIYVAPPGHHMKVAHGLVYLTRDQPVCHARPSIDELFDSLALEYQDSLLAILLCGFGKDGVAGCASLKAAGACVIIEHGADCGTACVLPNAAIAAGQLDQVATLPVIISLCAAAVDGGDHQLSEAQLVPLTRAIFSHYHYDFQGYRHDSLKRRLTNLMSKFNLPRLLDFERALFADPTLFNRLVSEISVAVSAFFRHPEQFRLLRERIFPYLASFPVIKLWSAGCATGEEPYSLAIVLAEAGLLQRCRLFATDFNAYLIEVARTGLFPLSALELSRANYANSGGTEPVEKYIQSNGKYLSIPDNIRAAPLFHRHSLVDEGIFNEFQLIICRNVMIYFKPEHQRKILKRFSQSLHRDGFLVLGPQDGVQHLARAAGFVPYVPGSHIYRLESGHAHG